MGIREEKKKASLGKADLFDSFGITTCQLCKYVVLAIPEYFSKSMNFTSEGTKARTYRNCACSTQQLFTDHHFIEDTFLNATVLII